MHRASHLLRRPVTRSQANIGGRSEQQGRGEGSQDNRSHIHPALDIAYPGESPQFAQPAVVRHRVAFIAVTWRSHLCAHLTTDRPLPAGSEPKRPAVLTKILVMEAVWPDGCRTGSRTPPDEAGDCQLAGSCLRTPGGHAGLPG